MQSLRASFAFGLDERTDRGSLRLGQERARIALSAYLNSVADRRE